MFGYRRNGVNLQGPKGATGKYPHLSMRVGDTCTIREKNVPSLTAVQKYTSQINTNYPGRKFITRVYEGDRVWIKRIK